MSICCPLIRSAGYGVPYSCLHRAFNLFYWLIVDVFFSLLWKIPPFARVGNTARRVMGGLGRAVWPTVRAIGAKLLAIYHVITPIRYIYKQRFNPSISEWAYGRSHVQKCVRQHPPPSPRRKNKERRVNPPRPGNTWNQRGKGRGWGEEDGVGVGWRGGWNANETAGSVCFGN